MRISTRTNAGVAVRSIESVGKQFLFATAVALNRTANDFQREQRAHQGRAFHLRRRQWADRNVKIRNEERAKRDRLEVTIRMEAPGTGRSDILSKFEPGGTKDPAKASRLAVPQEEVKRTSGGIIRRNQRPKAFDFERMGGKHATAMHVFQGKNRTFMIRNPDGTGGIYQRVGKRATKRRPGEGRRLASDLATRRARDLNVRILYRFTPESRIDSRLHFVENAGRVLRARFSTTFEEAFAKAMEAGRVRDRGDGKMEVIPEARRIGRTDVRR
jgi:hypothetical protein